MQFIQNIMSDAQASEEEKRRLIQRLKLSTGKYESQPRHLDRRGVKHETREQVEKTLRQVRNALGHRSDHPDPEIRHRAAKLIRSVFHLPFEKLMVASSTFVGAMKKSGHRRNEKQRQETGRVLTISRNLNLEEIRSVTRLQKAGRRLRLCVANLSEARSYMKEIAEHRSEIWVVQRMGRDIGLLEVHLRRLNGYERKRIFQSETFGNESLLDVGHSEGMRLLKTLQIAECDVETFIRVGALPIFVQEGVRTPLPDPIKVGEEWHYLWRTKDRIAIATTDKKPRKNERFIAAKMHWSYFQLEEGTCRQYFENHLSVDRVFGLMLESRRFHEALCDIRP